MNSAIQQEKFSDSSEDVTPSVSNLFKKTSLVTEEMFWAFHPHQPTNNVPFNTEATYYRKDTQGTKVRIEYGSHITKRRWQFIVHFV